MQTEEQVDFQEGQIGVAPPVPTTSDPTVPEQVQMAPKTHQIITRSNTIMTTVPIEQPPEQTCKLPRLNPEVQQEAVFSTRPPHCNRIPMNIPSLISQEAIKC